MKQKRSILGKLFIVIILVATFIIVDVPVISQVKEVHAATFAGGDGTKENPYLVKTAKQLNAVRKYNGCYFKQTADINLKNAQFKPLFSVDDPFDGCYDGGRYSISNIHISKKSNAGIFAAVGEEGIVKNVYVKNIRITGVSNIQTDEINYGAIVGFCNGTISGCKASIVKISAKNAANVGGICGWCIDGTIENCEAKSITATGCDLGGILGHADGAKINKCKVNKMKLSAKEYKSSKCNKGGSAAGIVGAAHISEITECQVSGKCVYNSKQNTGDFVGWNNECTIKDCK